MKHTILEQWRK